MTDQLAVTPEPRLVLSLFRGLMELPPPKRFWHEIAREVAERHGVPFEDLVGKKYQKGLASIRQEAWALIYAEGRLSYPQIGAKFGRDHTTILAGVRNHYGLLPRKRAKLSPQSTPEDA